MEGLTIREVREEAGPVAEEPRKKICHLCGKEKAIDEFPKNERCKDGHEKQCKTCKSNKGKKRYLENKKIPIVNPTAKAPTPRPAKPSPQPQPAQPVVLFDRYPDVLESLKRAAADQVRTLQEQICWYVKRGLKVDRVISDAELISKEFIDKIAEEPTTKPAGCGNWRGPE